jgi:hypothetical protein
MFCAIPPWEMSSRQHAKGSHDNPGLRAKPLCNTIFIDNGIEAEKNGDRQD